VDQAHQALLGHLRERREDTDMERGAVRVVISITKSELTINALLDSLPQTLSLTLFNNLALHDILTDIDTSPDEAHFPNLMALFDS